jgi:ribonuclease G
LQPDGQYSSGLSARRRQHVFDGRREQTDRDFGRSFMRKQVFVSVDRGETRVAILEGKGAPAKGGGRRRSRSGSLKPDSSWRVAELYIERRGRKSIVGNIYKGRVDNVLAGMEAAFVDIGLEKNGFLHVDEIVTPGEGRAGSGQRRGRGRGGGPKIADLLKSRQEVVVQVTKDPIGTKGARLSMEVSIPGRYLVYVPDGDGIGVSRRLPDSERERLRKLAAGIKLQRGGAIVRTAAYGARKADMERELEYLYRLHEVLQSRVDSSPAPAMVFQEADLPVRVVRDVFTREFERAVIDDPKQHHRVTSFFQRTAPELLERVELYEGEEPLFEVTGIESAFHEALQRRVDLPHGGYLMFDHAEALTVVDVNTGSYTGRGRGSLEDTIVKTNLQAAEEVVRQLRLRDIGGIIVIDFIDMAYTRNRDHVLSVLRRALEQDRTRTHVVEISPLGLVEMTRQNVSEGVREIMNKTCPTCEGEGVVRSEETIAIDVERSLRKLARDSRAEAFLVQVHPRVAAILIGGGGKPLQELEEDTDKRFHFHGTEGSALDTFAITAEGTREEIEHRALPFKTGEEVLIRIEEPHMYNVDDAIARIDGYVISISGGGPFVGEKKLIKIGEVKRTAAYATILSDNGAASATEDAPRADKKRGRGRSRPAATAEPEQSEPAPQEAKAVDDGRDEGSDVESDQNADGVQSAGSAGRRRRGRRGGRRRSRARAEKSSAG